MSLDADSEMLYDEWLHTAIETLRKDGMHEDLVTRIESVIAEHDQILNDYQTSVNEAMESHAQRVQRILDLYSRKNRRLKLIAFFLYGTGLTLILFSAWIMIANGLLFVCFLNFILLFVLFYLWFPAPTRRY